MKIIRSGPKAIKTANESMSLKNTKEFCYLVILDLQGWDIISFSTIYGLGCVAGGAAVDCGPFERAASLNEEGPAVPLFPNVPPRKRFITYRVDFL